MKRTTLKKMKRSSRNRRISRIVRLLYILDLKGNVKIKDPTRTCAIFSLRRVV